MTCFDIIDYHATGQVYIPCLHKQELIEETLVKAEEPKLKSSVSENKHRHRKKQTKKKKPQKSKKSKKAKGPGAPIKNLP
jgi:hypothetical protein